MSPVEYLYVMQDPNIYVTVCLYHPVSMYDRSWYIHVSFPGEPSQPSAAAEDASVNIILDVVYMSFTSLQIAIKLQTEKAWKNIVSWTCFPVFEDNLKTVPWLRVSTGDAV